MALPHHLNPFVLPVEAVAAERHGRVDLYLPEAAQPSPAIVFVHGGPIPADLRPSPRDWSVYRGYGSLAAGRGIVGVTVDHRLPARPSNGYSTERVFDTVRAELTSDTVEV